LLFHTETVTFFLSFHFLKKDLLMKLSAKCMLLSVSAMSLPALAQEQGASFENFLLSSPSIVSPSQYYQVKGGRFEALVGLKSGTYESKGAGGTEFDLNGQALGAGYAQALSSQLVLGADVYYNTFKLEVDGSSQENKATEIRPTVAFSISPLFSLGASININSGEDDNGTDTESFSYNTFKLGGTLHQDLWEASVVYTTANEDDEKFSARSPSELTVHGRYKFMPVLALGFRYDQIDHAGVQASGEAPKDETESSFGVVLESAVSDASRVEVAFQSTSNLSGEDGNDATRIFLSGGFDLAANMELGAQIIFDSADSDTDKFSLNTYALTLSMMN
jgi:hypothetical protein